MDELILFFNARGLILTVVALVGIVLLAVLKYCGVFKKFEEKTRHYMYLGVSVGFSVIGTWVYLLCTQSFTFAYLFGIACAIYGLNQTFYNIFKITPINKLLDIVIEKIVELVKKFINTDT